ncbi:MAG TPA: 3-oxoacyl-[acyl-carrier-protein] reductase [Thermodesulfobacteriota bacterium]|nr:3-oxoacyl-[acyl-carrier-protein] reductase [Thermodesulfobacteriota bacterium]
MKLERKAALVTGGAQGIGRAIALLLAREGAKVAVSDINLEKATETCRDIEAAGGEALAISGNVADLRSAEAMVEKAVEKFGGLNILVNNAGITRDGVLLRMKEEDWDAVMAVNLKGAFNCTKAVLRLFLKQKGGKIVNIASVTGEMGNAGQSNYAASKACLIGFTKSVAREYASRSINVNAVAPGFIDTAMTQAVPAKDREFLIRQIPMERLGTAEDVAQAVLFLASPAADYMTGQVLNVNGGMYM